MKTTLKNVILLLLLISPFCSGAQHSGPVWVDYTKTDDGDYLFNCHVTDNRPYYVIVYFNEIRGLTSTRLFPYTKLVYQGSNFLFKLKKKTDVCRAYFRYRYRYLDGDPEAKHRDDFPYLLPIKHGDSCSVISIGHLGKFINEKTPDTWASYGFRVNAEDSIFASRGGTVIEVDEQYMSPEITLIYSRNRNKIKILHADGTIAEYKNFKKNSIFPEVRDKIYAGEPLGISEPKNSRLYQYIYLIICYPNAELLDLNKKQVTNTDFINIQRTIPKDDNSYWKYIHPMFQTSAGLISPEHNKVYISEHLDEIILLEMTKREKKKWLRK